jgi:hypothetical protein
VCRGPSSRMGNSAETESALPSPQWHLRMTGMVDFIGRVSELGELRSAVGKPAAGCLGGRRRLGSDTELTARKAVTARIRDTTSRIQRVHPALGAHQGCVRELGSPSLNGA